MRLIDIVLLNVVAVTSLRWLASAASSGPSSLVLWTLAALFFFVPQGLAVAALSQRFPGPGGLYRWTKAAFGEKHGFICGWCYWINNLLYFPALLLFICANIAFAIQAVKPEWQLEKNTTFVTAITLGALWTIAGLSILGLKTSRFFQNAGAVANWVPVSVIVILGGLSLYLYGSANAFTWSTVLPNLSSLGQLSYFAQMCFALAGLELVAFFGPELDGLRKKMPLAIGLSAIAILAVYGLGTAGILVSVPQKEITMVNGVLLPLQQLGHRFSMPWLGSACAVVVTVAGFGAVTAWFGGASRLPYLVGVDRYLPASFGTLHPRFKTPVNAILLQTAIATMLGLFATLGSSRLETAYKLLVDMCLVLYFIPYCYLFLSLGPLLKGEKKFTVRAGYVGFAVTLIAIATTAIPSEAEVDWVALAKLIGGTSFMIGLGISLYTLANRRTRVQSPA